MIYTSYFDRIKEVPEPISIARSKPFWTGAIQEMGLLAPSEELLKDWKADKISQSEYIRRYNHEINRKFDPDDFKSMFRDWIYSEKSCTLLCWEKSGAFCHRHLLARMLIKSGIPCEEWK